MNKLKIIVLIIVAFFTSCNSGLQNRIKINHRNSSEHNVIVRLANDKKNYLMRIQFPKCLSIKNNSFLEKSFVKINYNYNKLMPVGRDLGIELFKNNNTIKDVSTTGKKIIPAKDSLEFIYYTIHFVDSTKATQKQFMPYIQKMLAQNKDTLHIGTVREFKQKHATLFKALTKNDSISIQFLDGKKLGERITVPVKW